MSPTESITSLPAAQPGFSAGVPLRELAKTVCAERLLVQTRQAATQFAHLNALAFVDWEQAQAQARQLDADATRASSAGRPNGALQGIPISIKDLYNVNGMPTRGGTRAALPALSTVEASAVTRLKEAGALIFAKTNMHEIALGATGENSWTGDVLNPFNSAHQAGGSSSGSAAAVASGIGLATVGSDTGGSVRIPAAFCGVVGFKPTYQAIPLDGALHLSWTCDHAGPLTRCVDDARLMFEVMAGRQLSSQAPKNTVSKPRIGIAGAWDKSRLSSEIAQDFAAVLQGLQEQGAQLVQINLDAPLKTAWEVYTPIVRAEAAYIHRAVLSDPQQASAGFSAAVLAPLQAGSVLGAGAYIDALAQRELARRQIDEQLAEVDILLTPTSAIYPPLRGQLDVAAAGGAMTSVREAVLGQTLAFSLFGLPALTVPVRQTIAKRGFPLGLQVISRRGEDDLVLALGEWIEARV